MKKKTLIAQCDIKFRKKNSKKVTNVAYLRKNPETLNFWGPAGVDVRISVIPYYYINSPREQSVRRRRF